MFTEKSFRIFDVEGLGPRMSAIRQEIQPIFQELGETLRQEIAGSLPEYDFYLHIAQHRRRMAHAPESTWCAISTQKRGYKMEPCWTLGIWKNYVFLYLSIIDQPKGQVEFADSLEKVTFDKEFVISKDHTKVEVFDSTEISTALDRLKKVKKSEFEIGQVWPCQEFQEKKRNILQEMQDTVKILLPVYKKLLESQKR